VVNETENENTTNRTFNMSLNLNQSQSNVVARKLSSVNLNKPQTKYTDLMKELNSFGKIPLTLFDGTGVIFIIAEI
jgi:hypothetical protein